MGEVFDRIDMGLEAFEKLVKCMKEFPNYDLSKDVEEMYPKENRVYKDFIKCGVDFVRLYSYESDESEPDSGVKLDTKDTEVVKETIVKEKEVKLVNPVEEVLPNAVNLENEIIMEKEVTPKKKEKKKKRNKEKRKERLLKFHQKLVQVSGLPPSRLMLQEATPQQPSNVCNLRGKKLEFNCDLTPGIQVEAPSQPQVAQPMTPLGQGGSGATSSPNTYSMLFSSPSPMQVSGPASYGCGWTVGNETWSEARPLGATNGLNGNFQQSPQFPHGLYAGISSDTFQNHTLCSCPQCSGSCVGSYQPPASPSPPPKPAYCSSCMLYGNVFTLTPA